MWISPSRARERQIPLFSVETQSHLGSVESFPIRKRSGVDDWTVCPAKTQEQFSSECEEEVGEAMRYWAVVGYDQPW